MNRTEIAQELRAEAKRLMKAAEILDAAPATNGTQPRAYRRRHWTQRPENRARVERQLRKMRRQAKAARP